MIHDRSEAERLRDMREAIANIRRYQEAVLQNPELFPSGMLEQATMDNLTIIGEAAKHISDEIKDRACAHRTRPRPDPTARTRKRARSIAVTLPTGARAERLAWSSTTSMFKSLQGPICALSGAGPGWCGSGWCGRGRCG